MSLPLIQPSLDSAIYSTKLTLELRYKTRVRETPSIIKQHLAHSNLTPIILILILTAVPLTFGEFGQKPYL